MIESDNCLGAAFELLERTVGPIENIGDNDAGLQLLADVEQQLSAGKIVRLTRKHGLIKMTVYSTKHP